MLAAIIVGALVSLTGLYLAVHARAAARNMRKTTFYYGKASGIQVLPEGQFYTVKES